MKKLQLITTLLLMFAVLNVKAQSSTKEAKDTTVKEVQKPSTSAKTDSIAPSKTVAVILDERDYNYILSVLKTADEKPSTLSTILSFIAQHTQVINTLPAEQTKQSSAQTELKPPAKKEK